MKADGFIRVLRIIFLMLIVVIFCPFAYGKVIYVDDDAIGTNEGSSWTDAYNYLQDAIANATAGDDILVAQGIYRPDQGIGVTLGDRRASFHIKSGVTITGGYAGSGSPEPDTRDVGLFQTILSGDLNGDDIEVNDPCDLRNEPSRVDNSSHIVTGSNTNATAVLDGFTVSAGYLILFPSMGSGNPSGGAGIYISSGSPTVANCIFTGNVTNGFGGGMINRAGSNPTLDNCTFTRNYAGTGGGISFWQSSEGSNPILIDCMFNDNYASGDGGGMYNYQSNPNLTNCIFSCNFSHRLGGGIYNRMSNLELTDCTFSENIAGGGGGMYSEDNSRLILTNCTFGNNVAERVLGGGMCNSDANDVFLTNCIFSGNSANRSGGGLGSNHNKLMLINCVFDENEAYGESLYTNKGGGLYVFGNTEIINCAFRNNWASEGAGVYYYRGVLTVVGCVFTGNSAENCGGGIYNYDNMPDFTITDCTFGGNYAEWGGGIFNCWRSQLRMSNCTFTDNIASNGNALSSDPSFTTLPGRIELTNCILWNGENTLFDPNPDGSTIAITYSDVQGGWPGEGNIDADPCFADLGYWADADDPNIVVEPNDPNVVWVDGDYHLKSQAGRWDPISQSWVQDDVTSPCIDAGDPNSPVGFEPLPNGGIINMGAYGGTPEASKSYILAKIIYVDDDAVGLNDGSSWNNAYTFLQDALANANSAEKPVEIRVAQGIYKPDKGVNKMAGDRVATFQLINGVILKGGYAGFGASNSNGRDIEQYQAILSGDLNGNDLYVADPCDLYDEPTRADNSYSVVTALEADETTVLDGFTVTGGNANGPTSYGEYPDEFRFRCGGGMYNWESSPFLTNCTFSVNAASSGGGLYNFGGSPTLTNCIFRSNLATDRGGGMENSWNSWYQEQCNPTLIKCTFTANKANNGGGVFNETSSPWMNNCEFIRNFARWSGGGMCNVYESNPTINFSRFIANSVIYYGGGLHNHESSPVLYNCTIIGNKTSMTWSQGGGIMNWSDSSPTLTNCTICDNYAYRSGGIHNGRNVCAPELKNCIVWGNVEGDQFVEPAQIRDGTPIINYCCVQDWEESLGGESNTNIDPCFVETGYWTQSTSRYPSVWVEGDYHLKSQAGRWDPASESWVQDDVTSHCIDAGDPNSPVGFEPLPNGGRINIGAYGGTEQASLSLSTTVANGIIIDQQLNAAGQGYTVVRLYGSYYEMGYAHGDLLADYVVRSVEETKDLSGDLYGPLRTAMAGSVWKPAEIEQELDGMVEALAERHPAAGIDKLDLKVYNGLGDVLYACRSHTCWGRYVAAPIKTLSTRRLDFPTPIGSLNHHVLFVYVPDDGSARWVNLGFPGLVTSAQGINEFGTLVSLHDYNSWGADLSPWRMPRMIACRYALTYLPSSDLSMQLSDVFAELQNYEIMTGTFLNYYAPEGYGGVMTGNPNRTGPDFYNLRTPQNAWHHGEAMITTNQWTNGSYTPADEDFGADDYYNDETPKTHESHWSLVDPVDSQDGLQRLSVAYRGKGDMTIWVDGRIDGIGRTPRLEYEWSELFGPYEQKETPGLAEFAESLMVSVK